MRQVFGSDCFHVTVFIRRRVLTTLTHATALPITSDHFRENDRLSLLCITANALSCCYNVDRRFFCAGSCLGPLVEFQLLHVRRRETPNPLFPERSDSRKDAVTNTEHF